MAINQGAIAANISMIKFVASKLNKLCDDVVFVGGAVTALLIDDEAVYDVRPTYDVDCIIDVISLVDFNKIEKKLKQAGFEQSMGDPKYRWRVGEMILDVMPTNEKILGFSNQWYKPALKYAQTVQLDSKDKIKIVSPEYFLATKYEAFKGRGDGDYLGSHDLEDIIALLDGRKDIADIVLRSDKKVRKYISTAFGELLNTRAFADALPGHFFNYGTLTGERASLVWDKMQQIAKG